MNPLMEHWATGPAMMLAHLIGWTILLMAIGGI